MNVPILRVMVCKILKESSPQMRLSPWRSAPEKAGAAEQETAARIRGLSVLFPIFFEHLIVMQAVYAVQ